MEENKNLQKLEEFVCDEDKIVTVPWLCAALAITVKDAKELINDYIEHSGKVQPGNLSVSYILSGVRDNTLCISLAKEEELDDKKDLYSKEPIVEVYSLQKSKQVDFNGIALVDYFNINASKESPILGSIISKNCIKRNFKPTKSLPPPPAPTIKEKAKIPVLLKLALKRTNSNSTTNSNSSSKLANGKTAPSPKQSAFGRFFTNGDQKPIKQEAVTPITKTAETKIASQKSEDSKSASQIRLSSLVDSDSDSDPISQQSVRSTSKAKPDKKPAKKKVPKTKRRKRIVVEEESDDDIFASDHDEEDDEKSRKRKNVITDSDEEQPVVKQEPLPDLPKNKKRKLVDQTFEDEDGFVITKKEYVEVDASEDESSEKVAVTKTEPQIKKEVNSTSKEQTKKTSPKNEKALNGKAQAGKGKKGAVPTNQTTLMTFFKRK